MTLEKGEVRPQAVVDDLREVLENNIRDPNPERGSSDRFVYTIPINFDISSYPRIHMQITDTVQNGFSLGGTERTTDTNIQISVFHGTSRGNKMDVDGDGEKERVNTVSSFITQRVIELVNDNQTRWRGLGSNVHYLKTVNENTVQNQENSVLQRIIDAELRLVR